MVLRILPPLPEGADPPRPLTLHEWRSRLGSARWLIAVVTQGSSSHAIAVQDAELAAGGAAYLGNRCWAALRFL